MALGAGARARFRLSDLPILMVTASNEAHDTVQSLAVGANDYLTKPVNLVVAEARLSAQLARRRAEADFRRAQEELRRRPRPPTRPRASSWPI